MANCFRCENDMLDVDGCASDRYILMEGEKFDPIPYGDGHHFEDTEFEAEGRCHDCGVIPGEYHHPGCDMETCPRCNGQYFVCDCPSWEKAVIWGNHDG